MKSLQCDSPSGRQQPRGSDENSDPPPCTQWNSLLHVAMQVCRKHGFVKDRVTLVTPSEFLQIVQLCQAQVHKRMGKGFKTDNSTISTLAQTMLSRKRERAIAKVHSVLHDKDDKDMSELATSEQDLLDRTTGFSESSDVLPAGVSNDTKPPCDHKNFQSVTPAKAIMGQKNEDEDGKMDESLTTEVLQEYDSFLANSNHIDAVDVLQNFLSELLKPDSEAHADVSSCSFPLEGVDCLDPLQKLIVKQLASQRANREEGTHTAQSQECVVTSTTKDRTVKAGAMWPDTDTQGMEDSRFESGDQVTESDMLEEVVGELYHSYLQLLVNTRSELALARVFNSPDRGLTHQAFTHLKHLAAAKNMSLYQTAVSIITQLRLGGSGYAPDPRNKLLEYVKGLSALSDLMSTLQEVLEDTECVRSSVLRVVGMVRKNLTACKSQRYRREMVEGVGGQIQRGLEAVVRELQGNGLLVSPDKPACQGGSLTSRRPRRVLLHYLDRRAVDLWSSPLCPPHHAWLQDVPFGPHTPSRFPCVLSQFRSPAADCTSSPVSRKGQQKETAQRKRKMMVVSTNLVPAESDQPLIQRCTKRLSDTVIVLPSKTIMHPAESRAASLHPAQDSSDFSGKENLRSMVDGPPHKRPKKAAGSKSSRNSNTRSSSNSNTKSSNKSNIPPTSPNTCQSLVAAAAATATGESGEKKGQTEARSSQPSKRASKAAPAGKKCRRRLLSPLKGQRSITSFFRL
ncbi:uncharacterized protein LOC143295103 [Babylonia areolata]|uniref:uncharacterized protein LOC143295103 n=1 Tax=Babylonia areolata TaxID=304850 RepID=UPI003FD4A58A